MIESPVIVGDGVREVLAEEAEVCGARARLEEQRVGSEETGLCVGCMTGHAVDGLFGIGDAGQEWRTKNSCSDTGLTKAADRIETKVRTWGPWLEFAGEFSVGCGDRDVDHKLIASVDLLEKVGIAKDEARLGHDSKVVAGVPGEDLQQAAGDSGPSLDRLPGVRCSTDGDLLIRVMATKLLLEQPGGVLFCKDESFKGDRIAKVRLPGRSRLARSRCHELVSVASVAVAAGKLTAAIRVDAPGHPNHPFRRDAAEDAADLEGSELDEMTVIRVSRFKGHARNAGRGGRRLIKDGEERFGGGVYFRHLFAFLNRE